MAFTARQKGATAMYQNPVPGMMVYDPVRAGMFYYDSSQWRKMHSMGETAYLHILTVNNFKSYAQYLKFMCDITTIDSQLTYEDRIILEYSNLDADVLLSNKELVQKFTCLYRFVYSLYMSITSW